MVLSEAVLVLSEAVLVLSEAVLPLSETVLVLEPGIDSRAASTSTGLRPEYEYKYEPFYRTQQSGTRTQRSGTRTRTRHRFARGEYEYRAAP